MKILIATDSFKQCLSAEKVGYYFKKGLDRASEHFEIRVVPMSDGGEGTVNSILSANNGQLISLIVKNAFLSEIKANYGILTDRGTAIIEMAAASGIEHLEEKQCNPWLTSSFGTGQLIKDALDKNCRRIIIGIGGSATNDGGVGMAEALGVQFLNKDGKHIVPGGGALSELAHINFSEIDKRLTKTEIIVVCDVSNPLCGALGASYIYGAQKGADAEMIVKLDRNLNRLADLVEKQTGKNFRNIPGSGAAGGLGFGLLAFCGGRLENGAVVVAHEVQLKKHCIWADVVITGEGKIDSQTKFGKTPQGVADIAQETGTPIIAVAGSLGEGYSELYDSGFTALFSIADKPMDIEESILRAPELLVNFGEAIGKMLLMKKELRNQSF